MKIVHDGKTNKKTNKGIPNVCRILANNSELKLPKGANKVLAGSRQDISQFNFYAETCEENAKSAKRKFILIEKETSTIDSPSKRPNSEIMANSNINPTSTSPHHATKSNSVTSKAMPSSNP